jgi:hypothetical protein
MFIKCSRPESVAGREYVGPEAASPMAGASWSRPCNMLHPERTTETPVKGMYVNPNSNFRGALSPTASYSILCSMGEEPNVQSPLQSRYPWLSNRGFVRHTRLRATPHMHQIQDSRATFYGWWLSVCVCGDLALITRDLVVFPAAHWFRRACCA